MYDVSRQPFATVEILLAGDLRFWCSSLTSIFCQHGAERKSTGKMNPLRHLGKRYRRVIEDTAGVKDREHGRSPWILAS